MGGADGRRFWSRRRVVAAVAVLVLAGGLGGYYLREQRKIDRILTDGEQALAAREYARAREYFERYLTERPTDTRARLLAARAARRARAYGDAREHLKRCRADGGEAEPIEVEESLLAVELGDERSLPTLRQRARADDDLALVILEVLIQYDLNTYQLTSAREGFTRYLARRPDDLHALLGRGFVWERFMSFADALEDYRRAVAAHPDNERARLKLAETLLIAGTPGDALEQYQWLANRDPNRPPIRLGLARCYRRLARPDDAVKILDDLIREFPDHGETWWERGELELERGRPATAEPMLRKAATLRPHDRRIQYAMYRCLLSLDRTAEAETFNARVKQLDADLVRMATLRNEVIARPNDSALRCEGGLLFLRNGEREEGVRWLQLALRIDPTCEPARTALIAEGVLPKNPPKP